MSGFTEPGIGNSGGWSAERLARIPEYKQKIIEGLRAGLFPAEIASSIEISTALIRKWRAQDRDFDEMCVDAQDVYLDTIEKEAIRRAVDGVTEPVVSQGRLVMDPRSPGNPLLVRKYSDSLMMFILRGRRRDVYGDKKEVEASVKLDTTGVKDELQRKFLAAGVASGEEPLPGEPD